MITRTEVERHAKSFHRARRLRDEVYELTSREWMVVSATSKNEYRVREHPNGQMTCTCPATTICRHMAASFLKTRLNPDRQMDIRLADVEPGDRVLVSERDGHVWHTVLAVKGEFVATLEVREFFRMDFIARHEPQGAAGRRAA